MICMGNGINSCGVPQGQGRKRNIFQRGQINFFPGDNFHFGRPKTNLSGFLKVKSKQTNKQTNKKQTKTNNNKQKKVLSSFSNFSSFHFQFSTFPFSFSLLFCSVSPFFLGSLFPVGQQKFAGQKSLPPAPPPACYATAQGSILGPLLFILHIHDIVNITSLLEIILFADDTTILFSL